MGVSSPSWPPAIVSVTTKSIGVSVERPIYKTRQDINQCAAILLCGFLWLCLLSMQRHECEGVSSPCRRVNYVLNGFHFSVVSLLLFNDRLNVKHMSAVSASLWSSHTQNSWKDVFPCRGWVFPRHIAKHSFVTAFKMWRYKELAIWKYM